MPARAEPTTLRTLSLQHGRCHGRTPVFQRFRHGDSGGVGQDAISAYGAAGEATASGVRRRCRRAAAPRAAPAGVPGAHRAARPPEARRRRS
jgi:hypothetical protein